MSIRRWSKIKRRLLFIIPILISVAAAGYISFRYFYKPLAELIYIVPDSPFFCLTSSNFAQIAREIMESDFGREIPETPIARYIRGTKWWREIKWQLRMWEFGFGVPFKVEDLKKVAGDRSVLALYRKDRPELFIASFVSSQGKVEITTSQATASKNYYGITNERYRGCNITTVNSGFPRRFHYAFIGKLGLLSTDEGLLKRSIDLYRGGGDCFARRRPEIARSLMSSDLSFYVDLDALKVAEGEWVSVNRNLGGEIISENELRIIGIPPPSAKEGNPLPPQPPDSLLTLYLRTGHIKALFLSPGRGMLPNVTAVTNDEGLKRLRSLLLEKGMTVKEMPKVKRDEVEISPLRISGPIPIPLSAGYTHLKGGVVIGTPLESVERVALFLRNADWNVKIDPVGHLEVDLRNLSREIKKLSLVLSLVALVSKDKRSKLVYESLGSLTPLGYMGRLSADIDGKEDKIRLKIHIKEGERDVQKEADHIGLSHSIGRAPDRDNNPGFGHKDDI